MIAGYIYLSRQTRDFIDISNWISQSMNIRRIKLSGYTLCPYICERFQPFATIIYTKSITTRAINGGRNFSKCFVIKLLFWFDNYVKFINEESFRRELHNNRFNEENSMSKSSKLE